MFAGLQQRLQAGQSVGVETVLSSNKYQALVESVIGAGGYVGLVYVALSSPTISKERVRHRVSRGGHGVPEIKLEQRWAKSLEMLTWFAARASAFWVYDNSSLHQLGPLPVIAKGQFGRLLTTSDDAFPELARALAPLPRLTVE